MDLEGSDLAVKQHSNFFLRFLNLLPGSLSLYDTTRLTIAFFSVSGLDLQNSLNMLSPEMCRNIIDWIYRLQVLPADDDDMKCCGFQGSSTLNVDLDPCNSHYKCGHLAMTYTGLATLIILGDDLSRVNRKSIISGVKILQQPEGNFSATLSGCESDIRFVYCAACISYILDDWSGFDVEKVTSYILESIGYDFGIAQGPHLESHGGTTYCAVATLCLTDQLHRLSKQQVNGLIRWLVHRQDDGFQGRPNKPVDTCYSFWIGATLKMLDALHLTNYDQNRRYVMDTQNTVFGGFSKWPDVGPDPMHTFLGLGGLSLIGEKSLNEIIPSLNISKRAYERLEQLHKKWRNE